MFGKLSSDMGTVPTTRCSPGRVDVLCILNGLGSQAELVKCAIRWLKKRGRPGLLFNGILEFSPVTQSEQSPARDALIGEHRADATIAVFC